MICTANLPIVTRELLAQWSAGQNSELASQVRLSRHASVLGPEPIEAHCVRVWRRGLPNDVRAYGESVAHVNDGEIARRISQFMKPHDLITLRAGSLTFVGNERLGELNLKSFTRFLHHPDILPSLTLAFASHFLQSLKGLLHALPGAHIACGEAFEVYRMPRSLEGHVDGIPTVVLHYSDPGTPYPLRLADQPGRTQMAWRTTAGDVNLHGAHTFHAVAHYAHVQGRPRKRLGFAFLIHECPTL